MDDPGTRRIEKDRIDGARFLAERRVTVTVLEGAAAGTELVLDREETVIGRNAGADISLPDDALSGIHATIELGLAGFRIRDLGSTNGTFVNGSLVEGVAPLGFGDEVQVGQTRLRLERARR